MPSYKHLNQKEKFRLYSHLGIGKSLSVIAKILGKHRSTVYRELKRNSYNRKYLPDTAHKKYVKRRNRKIKK